MDEKEVNDYLMGYTARLIVHLYDTHGYPMEYAKEKLIKDDFIDVVSVLATARKHRDFVKQENRNAKRTT